MLWVGPLLPVVVLFFGCSVDSKKVDDMLETHSYTDYSEGIQVIYTDSGSVRMIMDAEILFDLTEVEGQAPKYLFPKGLMVSRYAGDSLHTTLKADSVIHFLDSTQHTHLFYNVEIKEVDGTTIRSQYMLWDRKKEHLFTDSLVTIDRKEGEQWIGRKGFSTNLDFSDYELKQAEGQLELVDSNE